MVCIETQSVRAIAFIRAAAIKFQPGEKGLTTLGNHLHCWVLQNIFNGQSDFVA